MADSTTGIDEAARLARWRTCLHEGGHLVAARWLLKQDSKAVVFGDSSGATHLGAGSGPMCFKRAMTLASGRAATALAELYAPPSEAITLPLEVAYPETIGRFQQQVESLPTDDIILARWCIDGWESQPERWAWRHEWVTSSAEDFVIEHMEEIAKYARVMFTYGMAIAAAEPQERDVDVD